MSPQVDFHPWNDPDGAIEPEELTRRMVVYLFEPRFRPVVESGTKWQTIRRVGRRRPPRPGELLSLRGWEGTPYRSAQYVLREAPCLSVAPVRVDRGDRTGRPLDIEIRGIELNPKELDSFARADGFLDAKDMARYYESFREMPFEGRVISWNVAAGVVRS